VEHSKKCRSPFHLSLTLISFFQKISMHCIKISNTITAWITGHIWALVLEGRTGPFRISYQTHGWMVGWLDLRGREVMVVMQLGGKGSIASSFSCINGEMVGLRLHGKQLWRWRWRSCSSDTLRHSLRIQSAECTRCRHRIPLNPMAHAKRWCQVDVKIAPCDLSCLVSRIHKYFNF